MPTLTDEAVCVRRWDFSETSQTVSLFTRFTACCAARPGAWPRERAAASAEASTCSRGEVIALVKPGRGSSTLTD
ncbi:MAG: hypothetical protein U0575_05960 [Phycisphaerales bacterium]